MDRVRLAVSAKMGLRDGVYLKIPLKDLREFVKLTEHHPEDEIIVASAEVDGSSCTFETDVDYFEWTV